MEVIVLSIASKRSEKLIRLQHLSYKISPRTSFEMTRRVICFNKKGPRENLPGLIPIVLYFERSLFAAAGAVVMHFFLAEKFGAIKVVIHA